MVKGLDTVVGGRAASPKATQGIMIMTSCMNIHSMIHTVKLCKGHLSALPCNVNRNRVRLDKISCTQGT